MAPFRPVSPVKPGDPVPPVTPVPPALPKAINDCGVYSVIAYTHLLVVGLSRGSAKHFVAHSAIMMTHFMLRLATDKELRAPRRLACGMCSNL